MNRNEVYEVINAERDYQDRRFPAINGVSASPEGFLYIVEELLGQARTKWVGTDTPKDKEVALDFLRKIAATGVRAMEQHGAVKRNV